MDKIRIKGGRPLSGNIRIHGAKNAALKLMAAALLTDQKLMLRNVPALADIRTMSKLLAQLGVSVENPAEEEWVLQADALTSTTAPYELVKTMRASVLVLGPLVARHGEARVSLPGGCAIGARPIDLHIKALREMGAQITLEDGYVHAKAPPGGLIGSEITFPFVSVGATENALMAATLAKGETRLLNAAREPEIVDLGHCLQAMGAKIEGLGTTELVVEGVETLHGTTHTTMPDRIEAGSYMAAAAITGGDVLLQGIDAEVLEAVIENMEAAGVELLETPEGLRVRRNGAILGTDIMTQPYPGFPTDMQAQMMALLALAEGASMLTETIFENRFMHVPELTRMGASINLHGRSAMVRGVKQLTGAPVMATDLRASLCLVIAALAAKGETVIDRVYHLDRGYSKVEETLAACGAEIERIQ